MINRHYAIALKEIRAAATAACWLIGFALMAQVVVWALLTMTDLRYVEYEENAAATGASEIITADELEAQKLRSVGSGAEEGQQIDANRQLSTHDRWLGSVESIAGALGTMGALALLPLIGLGVVLAAGSATDGVEKTSGAFVWSVVLLSLSLPWNVVFEQVPLQGIFTTYNALTDNVEAYRRLAESDQGAPLGTAIMFYGRNCFLPVAALLGVTAIGLRFRAGVEAGLMPREDFRLDPALEKEIGKIKTTSNVGAAGRSAGALRGILLSDDDDPAPSKSSGKARTKSKDSKQQAKPASSGKPAAPSEDTMRSIRQPTPGEPLRRPI